MEVDDRVIVGDVDIRCYVLFRHGTDSRLPNGDSAPCPSFQPGPDATPCGPSTTPAVTNIQTYYLGIEGFYIHTQGADNYDKTWRQVLLNGKKIPHLVIIL